jgi:hypothetical protein
LRPYHKEILDALPEDIVSEIARRRLEQLEKDRQKKGTGDTVLVGLGKKGLTSILTKRAKMTGFPI